MMTPAEFALLMRAAKPRKLGPLLEAVEPVKPRPGRFAWLMRLFWD